MLNVKRMFDVCGLSTFNIEHSTLNIRLTRLQRARFRTTTTIWYPSSDRHRRVRGTSISAGCGDGP